MKQILMTSPVSFGVQYEINPWMKGQKGLVSAVAAVQQWANLRNSLVANGADVIVLPAPPADCPDAVFTANAGLIYKNTFIPSIFRHVERALEEPYFINWFMDHSYDIALDEPVYSRAQCSFEGAGDALFNRDGSILWFGFGFRSSLVYKSKLDEELEHANIIVRPLELVDPRFYHLDTCFCPLDTGDLLWYPPAFNDYSRELVESWYKEKAIAVSEMDAVNFACNSVSIGRKLVMPYISRALEVRLIDCGYELTQIDMSQFMKSGGACKCLTLEVVK